MPAKTFSAVGAVVVGGLLAVIQGVFAPPVIAHPGGLDARGCHNDRKNGGYHCHRGPLAGQGFGSSAEAAAALQKLNTSKAPPVTTAGMVPQQAAALPSTTRAANAMAVANNTAPLCGLARIDFEKIVTARMQTHEASGDASSSRAAALRREFAANTAAGRATPSLDGVYGSYSRYCAEGNGFMAGVSVGEWVGGALRATVPTTTATTPEPAQPLAATTTTATGVQSLPVRIEREGESWRISSLSTDQTFNQCEAQIGQSRSTFGSIAPKSAVIINPANFSPRMTAFPPGAQVFVSCRAGNAIYTATSTR